jgi:hypothetical protein
MRGFADETFEFEWQDPLEDEQEVTQRSRRDQLMSRSSTASTSQRNNPMGGLALTWVVGGPSGGLEHPSEEAEKALFKEMFDTAR